MRNKDGEEQQSTEKEMLMKWCPRCDQELLNVHVHKAGKKGNLCSYCKECRLEQDKSSTKKPDNTRKFHCNGKRKVTKKEDRSKSCQVKEKRGEVLIEQWKKEGIVFRCKCGAIATEMYAPYVRKRPYFMIPRCGLCRLLVEWPEAVKLAVPIPTEFVKMAKRAEPILAKWLQLKKAVSQQDTNTYLLLKQQLLDIWKPWLVMSDPAMHPVRNRLRVNGRRIKGHGAERETSP
jgi:hypothetical protein